MKHIKIILGIVFLNLVHFGIDANNPPFKFKSILNSSKFKKKIKITEEGSSDFFSGNLHRCLKEFYVGIDTNRTYRLKNRKNDFVVAEYVFKDSIFSQKSFQLVNSKAEFYRNLKRVDFDKRCYDPPGEDFYYVSLCKNSIFIFSMYNSVDYKGKGNDTFLDILARHEEYIIDDIYNEFSSTNICN